MRKLISIQYLRAIAVLLVVLFHTSTRIPEQLPTSLTDFLQVGSAGVDLFFIISGFIMWTICDDRQISPGNFLMRRISRIAPLYWIVSLAWVALAAIGITGWVKLSADSIIKSLLFIPHYSPSYPGKIFPVLVPGWTLNYEMFFYLLFAICLFLPIRFRLNGLIAILLAAVGLGQILGSDSAVVKAYTNPLLVEFLAGVLIGHAWRRGHTPKDGAAWGCLGLPGSVLA